MKITDIKIYAAEYAQTSKSPTNKKWVFLRWKPTKEFMDGVK